jgi:putative ABC transport system ATP-binding protein
MSQPAAEADESQSGGGFRFALRDLSRRYRSTAGVEIAALDGVDLEIEAGSVLAAMGPSGSGKSTLLHLLGGMDRADGGSIEVNGAELTTRSRAELVLYRRQVGFVFQRFALLPALTAADNVLVPVLPYKTDFDKRARARDLLGQVGLGDRTDAIPSKLSGGQQQRVAIARALINSPRVLLADEPTGNLDSTTGEEILDLLLGLRESHGLTVLLATHDAAVAARCDRVVQLRDGRIVDEPSNATQSVTHSDA